MSGHSKWSKIKHKKADTDAKRSKVFSKHSALIALAARDGGDLDMNPKLKTEVERAKAVNMPLVNIERAIKRGSGGGEGKNLEELLIETYGPGGKAVIITAITDNKNRTLPEIKLILKKNDSSLASPGSVKWMFEEKGQIILKQGKLNDELELKIIEAGAEDIKKDDGEVIIFTVPTSLDEVRKNISDLGLEISSAELSFIPKNIKKIDELAKEKYSKLFGALEENDDVNDVYYNFEF